MVTREFKQLLCDRYTAAELADFLDVSVEDFCEFFEEDIAANYNDLAEALGLRPGTGDNSFDQEDQHEYGIY